MTTSIPPLVLAASDVWAGNDGNWSTWAIKVGSSLQQFNIIPSTSHGEIWVPGPQGCTGSPAPLQCAESRGVGELQGQQSLGFQENASTTWEQIGIYEFVTGEDLFQTTEAGLYGLDDVVIGENNITVKHATVAGVVTKDFWLGSFGMAQIHSEFPVRSGSVPSLLDGMKEENLTSTASFGLSVGAAYSECQHVSLRGHTNTSIAESSPGSLVIGGYDQELYRDPGVEITVVANATRPLETHVRNIVASNTLNGTQSATFGLPSLPVAIDSGVSQLWLPREVCENLAGALGLTYDNSTELYLVNDTAHARLLELSPEFTFTLGANATSRETTNIVLPYAAFDLEVGQPFYNTSRRYFPIRQSPDDNLYVLGRAFLQEAYLVVDWERGNFTLWQNTHHSSGNAILAIQPIGDEDGSGGIRPAVIAGIVLGVLLGLIAVLTAVYIFLRRKRKASRRSPDRNATPSPFPEDKKDPGTPEMPDTGVVIVEASSVPIHELYQEPPPQQAMSTPVFELSGATAEKELDTVPSMAAEGEQKSAMLEYRR